MKHVHLKKKKTGLLHLCAIFSIFLKNMKFQQMLLARTRNTLQKCTYCNLWLIRNIYMDIYMFTVCTHFEQGIKMFRVYSIERFCFM